MEPILLESSQYPKCLHELASKAPREIYYQGNLELINPSKSISIVGTRKLSPVGHNACEQFISSLKDTTIVSGLAYGLDSCAHQAALDLNLPTIAVIASGLDCFDYFGQQRLIWNEMLRRDNCLILTEVAPGFEAKAWTFAHRNRIIAALSDTTVIIEAPKKSGALITADWAYQLKRNLLVLPGKGHNYQASNKLIEAGIAQELKLEQKSKDPILKLLPASFDLLLSQLTIDSRELTKQLSLLELEGKVSKEKGSYYPKVLENKSL
ncbi:MAG: DNA-protecting protein DprA [Candidatus Melainabacteria bacterium]|nr:DNA-protecting protein DprA [Candidatus Melainabacteria bacterium]